MQSPPHASAIEEVVQLLDRLDSSEKGDVTATSSKKPRLELGTSGTQQEHSFNVIVAVQQGNILATAFHPELTDDLRWHRSAS